MDILNIINAEDLIQQFNIVVSIVLKGILMNFL